LETDTDPDALLLVNQLDPQERPVAEELRGQRGHRQVQALDAQAGHAEQNAHQGGEEAAGEQRGNQRHAVDAHIRVVGACRRPRP
jgi:hypothetical protein